MRVVLKPAGLVALLLAIVGLAGLTLWQAGRMTARPLTTAGKSGSDTPTVSVSTKPTFAGKLVIDPVAFPWTLATQPPAEAIKTDFSSAQIPGEIKHAVRLTVTKVDPTKFWCAQLIKQVPQPIAANHNLIVTFWARSKTNVSVHVVFEEGQVPHTPELDTVIAFTPDWKEYTLHFRTNRDHTKIPANFCLKAGIMPGELEISEVRVADQG